MAAAPESAGGAGTAGQAKGDSSVPAIVAEVGEAAGAAYCAYIDAPHWTAGTRKKYRRDLARFLHWAAARGLTLPSIGRNEIDAYRVEIGAKISPTTTCIYLSPVHGFFRHLADAGVIAKNPCETNVVRRPLPIVAGFDLLALLAMLAFMEEASLRIVLEDEGTALSLLEQVRWPDGVHCPGCGERVEFTPTPETEHRFPCAACQADFSALTGTMFEASPLPLRHWLRLSHDRFAAAEATSDAELAAAIDVEPSSVSVLCSHMRAAMGQAGIPSGDALKAALKEKDHDLVNNQFARGIIRYSEMVAWRDKLRLAKAESTVVDGLPTGMTLDQALAHLEAQIAEEDRWVWYLDDGYIRGKLADEPALAEGEPSRE